MANPKVAMKAEMEAKYRRKYEEKLKEAENEFALKKHKNKKNLISMKVLLEMQI